ncbi:MAG: phage repressor protein/antirepressor Ant [Clostridiales bacterium]|jgi:prophage antirepressor-like protein|nr:phage repressor protein/antirepressor Ant [Clostridiales bacterium]
MNELQIFNSPEFGEIRTIERDGEPWFVGKDVAAALGYKEPTKATRDKVDSEDRGVSKIDTPSGTQEMTIINESGLYSLVLSSKLPTAKQFKRWVTSEVLPSIRKHGAYMTPETLEQAILNPDTIIKIATALKEEQDKRKALEVANTALTVDNQIMKPKAEYFDELVDRNLNTGIRETAKELGVKERSFVTFLLDRKYLYRDKKGKLQPYSQYADDLFVLKECYNDKTQWAGTQLLITPKGRETFRLLYLKTA